ncbi:MAG: hypothetical protein QOC81_3901 [Thermoanaerobaculia bacterium]|jgi:hypothetical protein|nr:hypothetical protein [Thermoanaerobaculia bacterium]
MLPGISGRKEDLRPPELFHYTSAVGFEQILRCRFLRATNFRFLDDPSEVSYGLDLVIPKLKTQGDGATRPLVKKFWRWTTDNVAAAALSDFYVCCFSSMEDDVSQWRAFGGGPVRYALGFDSEEFYGLAKSVSGRFASVVYKGNRQTERIDRFIEKASGFLAAHRFAASDVEPFATIAARHFVGLMTRFKSPKYEAEREARIIVEKSSAYAEGIAFDASRGFLRPYIAVPLAKPDATIPLVSVWVLAPGRGDSALKAAALVLEAAEIRGITPQLSTVPIAF